MKMKTLFFGVMIAVVLSTSSLFAQSVQKDSKEERVDGKIYRRYLLTFPNNPKESNLKIIKSVSADSESYILYFIHSGSFKSLVTLVINIIEAIEIETDAGIERFEVKPEQIFRNFNSNIYRQSVFIPLEANQVEAWADAQWMTYTIYLRTHDPFTVELKDKRWLKMQTSLSKLINSIKV